MGYGWIIINVSFTLTIILKTAIQHNDHPAYLNLILTLQKYMTGMSHAG